VVQRRVALDIPVLVGLLVGAFRAAMTEIIDNRARNPDFP